MPTFPTTIPTTGPASDCMRPGVKATWHGVWLPTCLWLALLLGGSGLSIPAHAQTRPTPPNMTTDARWADPPAQRQETSTYRPSAQPASRTRMQRAALFKKSAFKRPSGQQHNQLTPIGTPSGSVPRYLPSLPGSGHSYLRQYIRSDR